ncbi:MAG: hypothetical protein ACJAS4_001752 [Bacteriovoracaceae bacterium]|jgi:hypothetical protein
MLVKVKDQEMMNLNKLLENKAFSEAEEFILSKKFPKNVLNYNLGFLEYSKGNLVASRKYLEEAKFSGMFSEEVEGALKLVKTELELVYTESDISDYDNFIINSVSLPSQFYPTLSVLSFLLALGLLVKNNKFWGFISSLFGIAFLVTFFAIKDLKINYNLVENIIYRGPSRIFEEKQVLPPGAKFIISKETDEWKYIKYPAIYEGWVYKNKAI